MKENTEKIRVRVLSLIETEFKSDAAFERAMNLPQKTVNNWRRGRSSSFMQMLPTLSDRFGVNLSEFFNMPIRNDTSELSDEEMELLMMYRKSHILSKSMRQALKETLESTINMYISSVESGKTKSKKKK